MRESSMPGLTGHRTELRATLRNTRSAPLERSSGALRVLRMPDSGSLGRRAVTFGVRQARRPSRSAVVHALVGTAIRRCTRSKACRGSGCCRRSVVTVRDAEGTLSIRHQDLRTAYPTAPEEIHSRRFAIPSVTLRCCRGATCGPGSSTSPRPRYRPVARALRVVVCGTGPTAEVADLIRTAHQQSWTESEMNQAAPLRRDAA